MANLEIEGKISQKMAVQSGQGARGTWARQDFVLEYMDGNFPSAICFTAWGQEKVNDLAKFQVGDSVKVSFNIRGREYNGRWYNDLRVWRMSPAGAPAPAQAAPAPYQAPAAPAPMAPAPSIEDMPADFSDEDLPF
ncbi:MAG: DUF3127 domain-containing protein [Bacteroidales bacterium]|jgi:hypothetical protein|nr:DUF3127 domain-containing protein [Bacteroidales bacterium]